MRSLVLARFMLRCVLGCMLALVACGDGDASGELAADACEPGDQVACTCGSGHSGLAVCSAAGALGACECSLARTVPCSAPGAAFACVCDDGALGEQLCLADGRYGDCACEAAPGVDPGALDAGSDAPGEGATPPVLEPSVCPAPFSCVEQMGYEVCADETGLPPLCTSSSDCAAAGLPAAACLDPGVGGIMLCVQACER